jgi:phytanoyl-CoA hydroxylase
MSRMRKLLAMLTDRPQKPYITPLSQVSQTQASSDQKRFFDENGYLILESFFEPSRIARLRARIDELWADRGSDCPLVIDCLDSGERTYFREVDEAIIRGRPYKLNDTHLIDSVIQDFSVDPRLVVILTDLLSSTPIACGTLLFERSSQQSAHFDTFYMPSPTRNKMCASWIAIDPVTETNGPLFYYPKSHLIEPFRFSTGKLAAIETEMPAAEAHIKRIIEEYGLEEARFYPKSGDVLIWHAQLLHGGSPIIDFQETRKSLVTHYFTTLDYPDPADWIVVGPGRYLQRKGHQHVMSKFDRDRVDSFVRQLTTPPEHLVGLPPGFDPRTYLLRNLDVFRAGTDPYSHYHIYGQKEGRLW